MLRAWSFELRRDPAGVVIIIVVIINKDSNNKNRNNGNNGNNNNKNKIVIAMTISQVFGQSECQEPKLVLKLMEPTPCLWL